MPLTEEAFTALVDVGCRDCGGKKLLVKAVVAQKIPLLDGEPYGTPSWGYKGEDLVRGTYLIACETCKKELFTATSCPRCDAEGGLERALEAENTLSLPRTCNRCKSELLTALAFVPAFLTYEGARAEKARTRTSPDDPGFHAYRFECKSCLNLEEQRIPCPLCAGSASKPSPRP